MLCFLINIIVNKVENVVKNFEQKTVNTNLNNLFKQQMELEGKTNEEKRSLQEVAPLSCVNNEMLNLLDDAWFQKTGTVVAINEKKHNRLAAGHLKLFPDRSKDFALFSPNDSRLPRIKVKLSECPPDFYTSPQTYANALFIVQINDIPINSRYAIGLVQFFFTFFNKIAINLINYVFILTES